MRITIHRGSHEIGGTCIELAAGRTKILLDAGSPLKPDSISIDVAAINADAVIISHPHQDHCGLIEKLQPETPVYLGALAKELLDATRIFLDRPLLANNFQFFKHGQPFTIGDFKLTPYLVDHSAVDAYGFLIEAEGKQIFYSGDFRGHGNKKVLFEQVLAKPPKDIDLLFMEGTMLRRDNNEFPTEKAVQKKIREIIKDQKNISFLISSSQNIDRIVSAYNACVSSGKILVIDFYTAWVLEKVKSVSRGIKAMDWRHITVYSSGYSSGRQYDKMKKNRERLGGFINQVFEHTIKDEALRDDPARYLFLGKIWSHRLIETFSSDKPVSVIYSQWLGYLQRSDENERNAEVMATYQHGDVPGVKFIYAHTSGHATVADLQAFAVALKPKKLVPIHTEFGYQYRELFQNVVLFEDGGIYSI